MKTFYKIEINFIKTNKDNKDNKETNESYISF